MKLCILNKLGIMSVIALALTLVAASAAFADESSTNIGDASSFQDDAALWAMVDDKAKKDGAVCEETLVSGTDAQPYATAAKRPAKYPIAKGFILVTKDKYKGVVPSGHAGIIYSESTVIEAMPEGVVRKSNNWYSRYKTCYGAYVKNISQAQKDKAANWAKGQMGKWASHIITTSITPTLGKRFTVHSLSGRHIRILSASISRMLRYAETRFIPLSCLCQAE